MRKTTPIHALRLRLATGPLAIFCVVSAPLLTGAVKKVQLPASSVHQVIKNLAWNELQASEHPAHYYRYVERDISPDGSETMDRIATPHGTVGRLLEVDNHPPSNEQIQKNQQLLAKLPGDVQLQQSRYKDQRSDTLRRDNVIKDIPDAFIYTVVGKDSRGLIMLKFRPSPDFQPSSRQSLILEGMAGELWLDPITQRMVKIDGSLIQDVKIGWGFLARLNKGGTFLMEQSKGTDGTWHQKLLSVHFDGTVLIFKHLHIQETQIRCCFEQVPDNLSIREAVHLLQANTSLPSDWHSRLDAIQHSLASHQDPQTRTPR